jgi:hypothetical protein
MLKIINGHLGGLFPRSGANCASGPDSIHVQAGVPVDSVTMAPRIVGKVGAEVPDLHAARLR